KEEGELSAHPEVHSGEGIVDPHVLLNGDTVLEPVVKATDHDFVPHHASKHVSKQVSVAEMSRCSPEVPVRDSSEGSLGKAVSSNCAPTRAKRNLSCPP
ncbi:hypothetical protein A2U01_0070009, partial [Trifolium medium]|nr:hypothetical protein [Trifolium medium]